jgi:hypothetical protein
MTFTAKSGSPEECANLMPRSGEGQLLTSVTRTARVLVQHGQHATWFANVICGVRSKQGMGNEVEQREVRRMDVCQMVGVRRCTAALITRRGTWCEQQHPVLVKRTQ